MKPCSEKILPRACQSICSGSFERRFERLFLRSAEAGLRCRGKFDHQTHILEQVYPGVVGNRGHVSVRQLLDFEVFAGHGADVVHHGIGIEYLSDVRRIVRVLRGYNDRPLDLVELMDTPVCLALFRGCTLVSPVDRSAGFVPAPVPGERTVGDPTSQAT